MKGMKKILTILLCCFACLTVTAGQVTEAQARVKAEQFLKRKLLTGTSHARLKGTNHIDQPHLYVFNVENNGGYVIVSGDDRTKSILAYSDHGYLDMDHMPENMQWWLGYYERSIAALSEKTAAARATMKREPREEVETLIKTSWHQESPYNDDCPEIDTPPQNCLTGCLATAMVCLVPTTTRTTATRFAASRTNSLSKVHLSVTRLSLVAALRNRRRVRR